MKETACSEAPASSNVEPASPGTASSQVSCSSGREKVRWKLGKLLGRGSFASRMKVKKSRIGFLLYVHPAHKVVVVVVLTESADFTIAKRLALYRSTATTTPVGANSKLQCTIELCSVVPVRRSSSACACRRRSQAWKSMSARRPTGRCGCESLLSRTSLAIRTKV